VTPTLKDIATQVGVSEMTVSRALRGTGRMSEATRERIHRAASQLQYRPNAAARSMAQQRFGNVDLLLSSHLSTSLLPSQLLDAMHDVLARRELALTITRLPDEKLTDAGYMPRILRELAADGMLINYNAAIPQRMIDLIEQHHLPSVWLNSKRDHDAVYPDDLAAARSLTRRMLELGHRRVLYVDFTHGPEQTWQHYSGIDRRAGYEQAMRGAGLTPHHLGEPAMRTDQRMMTSLIAALTAPDRPTAVIAYSAMEGRAAVAASIAAGLDMPEHISIACFADRVLQDLGPRMATMVIPHQAMGEAAVDMLITKINDGGQAIRPCAVPFELQPAQTLGPCCEGGS